MLLMRIPTNPRINTALISLDDLTQAISPETKKEAWSALLDPKSVFRLLYCLQIIESLVETPASDTFPEEIARRNEWRQKFITYGGFQHLYEVLINTESVDFTLSTQLDSTSDATIGIDEQEDSLASGFSTSPAGETVRELKKHCMALLLKLVRAFVLAALSASKPYLYSIIEKMDKLNTQIATTRQESEEKNEPQESHDNQNQDNLAHSGLRTLVRQVLLLNF